MDDSQKPQQKSFWDSWAFERALPGKVRTRIIRSLRLVLPLIAVGVVGVVVAWPRLQDIQTTLPEAQNTGGTSLPANARNELVNPHYETHDQEGRPVSITARRAVQNATDPALVDLERPMADMTLENGAWLAGEADSGAYQQKAQILALSGNVRIFHDAGYELKTNKININLASRQAWGDESVSIQGPAGTLNASGMKMEQEKNLLIFTGPARVVLTSGLKGL